MSTETPEQEPEPNIVSARGNAGPGSRLRNARLAKDQDLATIADNLHLTATVVQALEQDDYSDLTARVFVRGYLRNYARLIGVPVEEILDQFDQKWPASERPMQITPPPRLAADSQPKHRWRTIITGLLITLGTLLFLLWWQGYLSEFWQQKKQQPLNKTTSPPLKSNLNTFSASANEVVIPAEPLITPPTVTIPLETALTNETDLNTTRTAEENISLETTTEEPITPAKTTPLPTEDALPIVTISFRKDCWVDIRDKTRTFKLVGKMTQDSRHELQGEAPYQIVIGNAAAASISIDGKPYDLSQHTRGNVARFILQL